MVKQVPVEPGSAEGRSNHAITEQPVYRSVVQNRVVSARVGFGAAVL
jgi:hypothetical protein